MVDYMEKKAKRYLYKFYDALYDNFIMFENKVKNKSILISFLKIKKNSRNKLISESSLSSSKIPNDILNLLLSEKLVQSNDEINNFFISAKGVWVIEKEKGIIDEEILLDYINEEYFAERIKPITSKEKIILFSMIAARTFSEMSAIDLKKDVFIIDSWKEIIDLSAEKLSSLKVILRKEVEDLYGSSGNENVVSRLFRNNSNLASKIKQLYKYPGDQKYYLDIYDGSQFFKEKLSYLLWEIFGGNLSDQEKDEIINFCNEISSKKGIYVFELNEHIFSMPKYDVLIEDCLMDSIISKGKWEQRK
jgi:hypothetical protein